jgi:hypothetical protein
MAGAAGEPIVLSVVVGSRVHEHPPTRCLDALLAQRRAGLEVVVAADADVRHDAIDVALVREGALVPELWADGIRRARGSKVALLSGVLVPADDYVDALFRLDLDDDAGVGGPIEPAARLRARDWAAYFCRYAPYMRPLPQHDELDLPGDNACYAAAMLERYESEYADGFWEPTVHRAMRRDGHRLSMRDAVVVRHPRGIDFGALAAQRVRHGRRHGRDRASNEARAATMTGIATAVLVPFVMTARVVRTVMGRQRHRLALVASMPFLFVLYGCWAYGELRGRLDGLRGGGA